jgi:threonyl-tRNA synthetase
LTGLLRVREITQDDAHIFVAENQLEDELVSLLKLVDEFYKKFELRYMAKLSTMPDNHLGSDELWDKAISHLKNALERNGIKYEIKEKEGAFYGPKIDIDVKDSMDREWQCATIQLDYQLPKRFDLTYTGDDGKEYMPVIIHRVIYGSLERFIGVLTEHVKGKFPTWMSPSQVSIIPISDKSSDYAGMITKKLREKRIRANFDDSDKTLDYKIRDAKLHEVPYTVIVGAKEMEKNTISIRDREGKQIQDVELKKFMEKLKEEIEERVNGSRIVEQLLLGK